MIRTLALLPALVLAGAAAQAQQQSQLLKTPGGLLSAGTPGVGIGTTGTTYGIPGAEPQLSVPGGSIPMGAATQEDSPTPSGVVNYNNGGVSSGR
jgi:hypothetical protein